MSAEWGKEILGLAILGVVPDTRGRVPVLEILILNVLQRRRIASMGLLH